MPGTIALYTGTWDLPLAELAEKASEWGYQALELECTGDHCSTRRAVDEPAYLEELIRLVETNELRVAALSYEAAGALLTEGPSETWLTFLPEQLRAKADLEEIRQHAACELQAAAQTARRLGANIVVTGSGCPLPVSAFFAPRRWLRSYQSLLQELAGVWTPILDDLASSGIRLAFLVQPGQLLWDPFSAEMFLEALSWHTEVGLAVDTGALYWQGTEPAQFIRQFADRILHVRIRDVAVHLTGGNSVLSPLPEGDPRRGWDSRSPGHGQVDFESVIRALHDIGYTGALSVAWDDPHMQPDFGAADACQFLKRLDFPARQSFTG